MSRIGENKVKIEKNPFWQQLLTFCVRRTRNNQELNVDFPPTCLKLSIRISKEVEPVTLDKIESDNEEYNRIVELLDEQNPKFPC